MKNANLKEILNEKLIKRLFELSSLSISADHLWFYHYPTKQRYCINTRNDLTNKESINQVSKILDANFEKINEPSYYIINNNNIQTISNNELDLELTLLFPVKTLNNVQLILIAHKQIDAFNKEEINEEIKRITKFLDVILYSFPSIPMSPKITNTFTSIMIQEKQKGTVYSFEDVLFLEANGNYTYVHINGRKKPSLKTAGLKQLEEKLPKNIFIRIHKSILVNKFHIENCDYTKDNSTITLTNGKCLPVATRKRNELILALKDCNIVF